MISLSPLTSLAANASTRGSVHCGRACAAVYATLRLKWQAAAEFTRPSTKVAARTHAFRTCLLLWYKFESLHGGWTMFSFKDYIFFLDTQSSNCVTRSRTRSAEVWAGSSLQNDIISHTFSRSSHEEEEEKKQMKIWNRFEVYVALLRVASLIGDCIKTT